MMKQYIRILLACAALGLTVLLAVPARAAAPAVAGADAPEYRLGGGDLIKILVYQNPDLTLETRLSDTGSTSYPLLGAIKLGGLTVAEAEQLIAGGLRKGDFVKDPQVTVVLETARGSQVSVLGQVQRPGRYVLETGQTHLSDVLAMAGGLNPQLGADQVTVVGTREGKPFRQVVDLPQMFNNAERPSDLLMQGNDVVYVDRTPVFYIYGEVQRPGQLRVERGMTLLQGLAAGGGLTLRGTERGIRIHRRTATGIEVLEPDMQAKLQDGDVIYVQQSLF